MDAFVEAANGLADAVDANDMKAVGANVKMLGGSCKGCHDDFQEEH